MDAVSDSMVGRAVGFGAKWAVHWSPSQYLSLPSGVGYHPAGAFMSPLSPRVITLAPRGSCHGVGSLDNRMRSVVKAPHRAERLT